MAYALLTWLREAACSGPSARSSRLLLSYARTAALTIAACDLYCRDNCSFSQSLRAPTPSVKKTLLLCSKSQNLCQESKCSCFASWNCATSVQCCFDNLCLNVRCGHFGHAQLYMNLPSKSKKQWFFTLRPKRKRATSPFRAARSLSCRSRYSLSNCAPFHRFGFTSGTCLHFQRACAYWCKQRSVIWRSR